METSKEKPRRKIYKREPLNVMWPPGPVTKIKDMNVQELVQPLQGLEPSQGTRVPKVIKPSLALTGTSCYAMTWALASDRVLGEG